MNGDTRHREYLQHARAAQQQAAQQQAAAAYAAQAQRLGSAEARFNPAYASAQREARAMAMTDGSVPMGAPPAGRRVRFDPALEGSRPPVPRPVPPAAPMTAPVTGSSMQIAPADDPLSRLEHAEAATAAAAEPAAAALDVLSRALQTLLLCFLAAGVFALPPQARVLWLVVAVQAVLASVGACLFQAAVVAGEDTPAVHTGFSALLVAHAAVCVAVVATAAWRVYKTISPGDEAREGGGTRRVVEALAPAFAPGEDERPQKKKKRQRFL